MQPRIRVLLAAAALVIVGACGGGDDDEVSVDTIAAPAAESSEAAAADTEAADTVPAETEPADTEPAVEDTLTDAEASEQVAGIEADADFCAKLDEVGKAGEALFEGAEFADFEEQAAEAVNLIRSLVDDAPDELKNDLEITADAFETIAPLMGEMAQLMEDPTNPDNQARLEEIGALFQTEIAAEADASSQRISAYISDVCGIEQ